MTLKLLTEDYSEVQQYLAAEFNISCQDNVLHLVVSKQQVMEPKMKSLHCETQNSYIARINYIHSVVLFLV